MTPHRWSKIFREYMCIGKGFRVINTHNVHWKSLRSQIAGKASFLRVNLFYGGVEGPNNKKNRSDDLHAVNSFERFNTFFIRSFHATVLFHIKYE